MLGYVIASIIGIAFGLGMASSPTIKQALQPWISGLYATPTIALAPLFILWLGIGIWSKVLVVIFLVLFPVTINTEAGLRTTSERWDVIVFDAYGSSAIPFHLVTRECYAEAKARLEPGGVLALNVEAWGWHHPIVHSLASTLRTEFAHVVALPIAEPPTELGNVVLLASDREMSIPDAALGDPVQALVDPYEHWKVVTRRHAWDNRFEPVASPLAPVLTDDRNRVDLWAEEINRVARRQLHEVFGAAAFDG